MIGINVLPAQVATNTGMNEQEAQAADAMIADPVSLEPVVDHDPRRGGGFASQQSQDQSGVETGSSVLTTIAAFVIESGTIESTRAASNNHEVDTLSVPSGSDDESGIMSVVSQYGTPLPLTLDILQLLWNASVLIMAVDGTTRALTYLASDIREFWTVCQG